MFSQKRSEGTLLLELEHLKADNERLVNLLKKTPEFRDFSMSAGGKPSNFQIRKENASKEMDDWVPSEAWRLSHDFLAKYGSGGFSQIHVNKLLDDLNKAWRKREKRVIS